MFPSKLDSCVLLLIVLGSCLCLSTATSHPLSHLLCQNAKDPNVTNFNFTSFQDTEDAKGKAPSVGSIQRLSELYGFIEHSSQPLIPFKNKARPALNNTWRILCGTGYTIYTVLMSLRLAYDDYLQIKLKQERGFVGDRFYSYHFSKKSILVSLNTDPDRNMFDAQSSFLLGYVCVAQILDKDMVDGNLERARAFFENDKVLEYLHCRPQSFEKLAKELSDKDADLITYPVDTDIGNLLDLKNGQCLHSHSPPPCTSVPDVPYTVEESSADGISV